MFTEPTIRSVGERKSPSSLTVSCFERNNGLIIRGMTKKQRNHLRCCIFCQEGRWPWWLFIVTFIAAALNRNIIIIAAGNGNDNDSSSCCWDGVMAATASTDSTTSRHINQQKRQDFFRKQRKEHKPSPAPYYPPTINQRWNPELQQQRGQQHSNNDPSSCRSNALCVGPISRSYPIGRRLKVKYESEFVVPPLPVSFSPTQMTYYDYFNIYFGTHTETYPGYFNQFVPQLMLGNALANSTNHPHYIPQWIVMDTWHIGSQYFFGLCNDDPPLPGRSSDNHSRHRRRHHHHHPSLGYKCTNYTGKAATGKLIPVVPGEGIFTTFELVNRKNNGTTDTTMKKKDNDNDEVEWHLTMGVIGDPERISKVVVEQPYMGLIPNITSSWLEPIYDDVIVGSCLENYNLYHPENYPTYWRIDFDIELPPDYDNSNTATKSEPKFWSQWHLHSNKICDYQPNSDVDSIVTNDGYQQHAHWKAWLHPGNENADDARKEEEETEQAENDEDAVIANKTTKQEAMITMKKKKRFRNLRNTMSLQ